MGRHVFSFDPTGDLTTMGAAWFIVRDYSEKVDYNEVRWKNVKTYRNRNSVYLRVRNNNYLYNLYLKQVKVMDVDHLSNSFEVSPNELSQMRSQI